MRKPNVYNWDIGIMGELKSEIAFPKEKRKVLGNDSENYQLILDYSTALTLAELEAKEAIDKMLSVDGVNENKLKEAIAIELQELIAEPEGTYEDGHNGGIEACVSIIKKLDFTTLLTKGE